MNVYRPLTILELREELKRFKEGHSVLFDFCGQVPVGVGSSRGSYDEPSIIWGEASSVKDAGGNWVSTSTVATLYKLLRALTTETFEGYKGGKYKYGDDSPLWCDKYGEWTATGIVGVGAGHPWYEGSVILITAPGDQYSERWTRKAPNEHAETKKYSERWTP